MAISLESEFRSLKASPGPEAAGRRPAKPDRGEGFASSLDRARSAEPAETERATPDMSIGALAVPLPRAEPDMAAPQGTPPLEAALIAPATLQGESAPQLSELEIDRAVVREGETAEQRLAVSMPLSAGPAIPGSEAIVLASVEPAPAAPLPGTPLPIAAESATPESVPQDPSRPAATGLAAVVASPAPASPKTATTLEGAQAPAAKQAQAVKAKTDPETSKLAEPAVTPAMPAEAVSPDAAIAAVTGAADKASDTAGQTSLTTGVVSLAASGPSAPQAAAPAAAPVPMTPAHAILTASPAGIVDIVAKTAEDGQSDRVVVQLDPPELGRVSIDFKFDAHGLQHVTITSETPEAMRQLRQMHTELMQALERQGIGSQNMTFQHQQQSTPQTPAPNPFARAAALGDSGMTTVPASLHTPDNPQGMRTLPGGRLDIRL